MDSLPPADTAPFGWDTKPISQRSNPRLEWSESPALQTPSDHRHWLRLTTAVRFDERRSIAVDTPDSDRRLGTFDLRYSYPCQPFELRIDRSNAPLLSAGGVVLTQVAGSAPTWVLSDLPASGHDSNLVPHILVAPASVTAEEKERAMDRTMQSAACHQPFGWMEGCVLDGMLTMATSADDPTPWRANAGRHLDRYLTSTGELAVDPGGIESMLMLRAFVTEWPTHSVTEELLAYTRSLERSDGIIRDGAITAEGAYTVAYPLMQCAVSRDDPRIAREAVEQLIARADHLPVGDDLYLRSHEDGSKTFKNWSRAYAWYMIGIARTIRLLETAPETVPWNRLRSGTAIDRLCDEWDWVAEQAIDRREPVGLWSCFLGETETGIETSGSAGIAAAIGHVGLAGLTDPDDAYHIASTTYRALLGHVTPDGLLTNVAQHNAGGESLQRGGYRVIAQYGLGLLTQLRAVIAQYERNHPN